MPFNAPFCYKKYSWLCQGGTAKPKFEIDSLASKCGIEVVSSADL